MDDKIFEELVEINCFSKDEIITINERRVKEFENR